MTEDYLKNITPDSLSGLIFGFEGIRHALTILNGPTGCKFYNSITVENQSLRKDDFDPLKFPEVWFFGQGRVPCTYLDKRDYVYGSEDKLTDAIKTTLARIKPEILVVVNTPGAALIGDDLERIAKNAAVEAGYGTDDAAPESKHLPVITCQSPGYSKDVTDGFKKACLMAVDALCSGECRGAAASESDTCETGVTSADSKTPEPVVNLLGLSIYQKYHMGDINEIERLLGLCGIRVNTAVLCESTIDEIRRIPEADLNVVINTDWGLDTAEELKSRFGTPYVCSEYGYPVGYKAMEKMLISICDSLAGADPEPALESLRRARAQGYIQIARMNSLTGLPKGVPFAVYAQPAMKHGYSAFLSEYLGMKDVNGAEESMNDGSAGEPDIVLGDGNTIARMKAEGKRFTGIEISLPTVGYIDVIEKTHLGAGGTLFLIEQILNSMIY